MKGERITVGTTATLVVDGKAGTGFVPESVVLHAPPTATVYYGGPDVLTTTGYAHATTDPALVLPAINGKLYAVVAAQTQIVTLLRSGS